MTSRQRQSVLKKIRARRKDGRADAASPWAALLRWQGATASVSPALPSQGLLTRREMDVLRLVATGQTDRAIAESLFLSHRTVSNHVSNILGKLNVPSRKAAVLTAMQVGLL